MNVTGWSLGLITLGFLSASALAQDSAPNNSTNNLTDSATDNATYGPRFDTAWQLVEDRYWDRDFGGNDWNQVRAEYEPRALKAESESDFYSVLADMYEKLGDNHSVFVPPNRVNEIRAEYGDLPCLGVFGGMFAQVLEPEGTEQRGRVSYKMLEDDIGYLRVPDLVGTASDLRTAVQNLRGAESLILDLRGNPGGRLVEMMQAAGIFTSGFLWRTLTRWTLPLPYPAIGSTITELPLVVLIDGGVNSAAEGLAGALQAKGRATIVGETSAGNVEAVLPFCLRDGSQAWIASGVLAPIGGPTWEGRGVVPDVETSSREALDAAVEYLKQQ